MSQVYRLGSVRLVLATSLVVGALAAGELHGDTVDATYDTTLMVPSCALASGCSSGSLLVSRGAVTDAPEPNAPNTLNGVCADGDLGVFHSDESIDVLLLETADASDFSLGDVVNLTATVWAIDAGDTLHVYYAPNVSAPEWTLVQSFPNLATGEHVLTTSFTLGWGGNRRALRAVMTYSGDDQHPTEPTCVVSDYADHDDLVFEVQPAVRIDDVATTEGSEGTKTLTFTVTRTPD